PAPANTPDTPNSEASEASEVSEVSEDPEASEAAALHIASEIIGAPVRLHPAQAGALKALSEGKSILAVMATGRGKSLIFQTHAARLALASQPAKAASVFIYPLRALIADQHVHIADGFARLGLKAASLTGENTAAEKDALFQSLYEGDVDVLLTTPEFFRLHAWRFAQSARVRFIVFDEAHHIQTESVSDREAYHELGELRRHFPEAQYLAVTATSDDRITGGICRALGIDHIIVDDARRDNLRIDDARNLRDRESYLVSIVQSGGKTVIYANSRAQAVDLARMLRKGVSNHAESVVFYHAGLARAERQAVEEGFRCGKLKTIISTSAFGEGVNVPDIAHVVLYNLPLNAVAFNQMSGRAGRNGQEATIHLLYTSDDTTFNRRLLTPLAPKREELITLYRALRKRSQPSPNVQSASGGAPSGNASASASASAAQSPLPFVISLKELVEQCGHIDPHCSLDERGISNALAIFGELGLLSREEDSCDAQNLTITLAAAARKVELAASSRYLEGREELALFERFRQWALEAPAEELRQQLCGPLTPGAKTGNDSNSSF
ncbi:MAG: DEAD/DEAH box helicase, partial [Coriobacteriales bacterium]|nr:DEAD/DEAH box helicase [Coriobacteriales bacterium]